MIKTADARTHRTVIDELHDPTERALLLLSLLQTHRFWPGEELTARLGVSARTLRRDVDRLRVARLPGRRHARERRRLPPRGRRPPAAAAARRRRSRRHRGRAALRRRARRSTAWRTPRCARWPSSSRCCPTGCVDACARCTANVASLQWRTADPTVDAEALAVLALACRDREQVRFDYRRRDGDDSSRLVEPHQLVSTGRRWYLVAWDVRRDDWRTFRLDRLERAAAGRRAVRARASSRAATRPRSSRESIRIDAPTRAPRCSRSTRDRRRRCAPRSTGATPSSSRSASGRCRVRVEGSSDDALLRVVTWLAGRYPVVGASNPVESRRSSTDARGPPRR